MPLWVSTPLVIPPFLRGYRGGYCSPCRRHDFHDAEFAVQAFLTPPLLLGHREAADTSQEPEMTLDEIIVRDMMRENETMTNCHALKMKTTDGEMRLTNFADME